MSSELVEISEGPLRVTVSNAGAEMQSFSTGGTDLLWYGDAAWWGGRSPVLFPIVGRAPGDEIIAGGLRAPMMQHGFARRSRFTLVEAGPATCLHELRDSEATRAVYPFAFRLTLRHQLAGGVLSVTAEVENTGSRPMPFGLGFHPAFLWPLPFAQGKTHEVVLGNGAEPARVGLHEGLIAPGALPSPFQGGRLVLEPGLFADDALIFPEGAGQTLRYGPADGPGLRFRFDGLPNLALWQKQGAPYICIEPWHGMAARAGTGSEISERPFAVVLGAGGVRRFGFSVAPEGF